MRICNKMQGYLHIITAVIHSLCKGSHNILRGIMCHKFDNFIEQILLISRSKEGMIMIELSGDFEDLWEWKRGRQAVGEEESSRPR